MLNNINTVFNLSTKAINRFTPPSQLHGDPGLHIPHIRVSHVTTPGSEELLKLFLAKKQLVLIKKQAVSTYLKPLLAGLCMYLYVHNIQ